MKLSKLITHVDVLGNGCDLNMEITSICYNSKEACKGSAFVAIKGFKTDGHRYAKDAIAAGAVVAVVETVPEESIPYLLVKNSRRALAQMSAEFFGNPQDAMKFVGVTGTNGKTTVTNLIKAVLDFSGAKCGLIGTNENMIDDKSIATSRTTPESYDLFALLAQMRDAKCKYVIMECSSHSLELERVFGINFEVAAFTNLTQDHLDFHGTMEKYLRAKSKLFDVCKTAVINFDDDAGQKLIHNKKCYKITYSAKSDAAELMAKNVNLRPQKVEFEAVIGNNINRISLGIPGMFSVYNALCAVGCCIALAVPLDTIAVALHGASGVRGRAEVVPVPAEFTVIIDYAHSPDSIENILKAVNKFATGRVISVFGAGGDRDVLKRPLMGAAASQNSDICIVTSDNPRTESPAKIIEDILPGTANHKAKIQVIDDRRLAIKQALSIAKPNDIVVLMGKGHETYQEINGEKLHLDEREEIAAFFDGKK